jgi:hypothetical protein
VTFAWFRPEACKARSGSVTSPAFHGWAQLPGDDVAREVVEDGRKSVIRR